MLVVRRGEQQLGRVGRAGRDDDDVALVALLAPSRDTTTPVTVRPLGVGLELVDLGPHQQRDVGQVEQRAHGDGLGVGLGVHEAGVAVAPRAADAGAPGPVGLVEQDAARRVERVVAAAARSSESCWMRGSCETAGQG